MIKTLLFDFDGTIAASFENFIEITNKLAIKHHFMQLSRAEFEKLRSKDARTLIKILKVPFYKLPFIARDMKQMQQQHIASLKPFKGLPEVLCTLKDSGYTLGILTSNGKDNVDLFMKKNNIDAFSFINSDANIFGKDKAIATFLKQHHLNKEDVLYVGDEIRDIQACQKIGVKIISVSWGFNTKDGLINYNPDYLIDKPSDFLNILDIQTK